MNHLNEFFHPTTGYTIPTKLTRIKVSGKARNLQGIIRVDHEYMEVVRALSDTEILVRRQTKETGSG